MAKHGLADVPIRFKTVGAIEHMTPRIIIVGGLPGTGKTTLANALSRSTGASVYTKDRLEAAVLRRGLATRETLNGVGYELLAELALGAMATGRSSILDCIASFIRVQAFWGALLDHDVRYIECTCSDVTLHRQRLAGRNRDIPGWYEITWEDVEQIRASYRPWTEERLCLDAKNSLEENAARALDYAQST